MRMAALMPVYDDRRLSADTWNGCAPLYTLADSAAPLSLRLGRLAACISPSLTAL